MIFIKSLLISVLIVEAIICTFTDFKSGKIFNYAIITGTVVALIGNVLYFLLFGYELFFEFVVSILSAVLISIIMYALHIWAGGDVKLFVLFSALVPADLYKQKAPLSIVTVYIIVFSLAFVFLVLESILLLLKKEKIVRKTSLKFSAGPIISCMVSIAVMQTVLRLVFKNVYYEYLTFFLLLNVIFVLLFDKIKFLHKKWVILFLSLIAIVFIFYSVINGQFHIDIRSFIITAAVICFRGLAENFNYQEIDTADVKKGMILSYATVLEFSKSRIKGLPQFTTEDLSTRITQDEADSIVRWSSSKYGKDKIVILRKLPFALFISIGFIIYLCLGVFVW